MINPYLQLELAGYPALASLGWQRLKDNPHGDFSRWLENINNLPESTGQVDLDRNAPLLGDKVDDPGRVGEQLMGLSEIQTVVAAITATQAMVTSQERRESRDRGVGSGRGSTGTRSR